MAAQQGFLYEQNTVNFLKNNNLSDGKFAGASHDKPDLMLTVRGQKAGCELKISAASAGSLVIKYDINNTGSWTTLSDIRDDATHRRVLGFVDIKSVLTLKVRIELISDSNDAPELESVYLDY